MAGTAYYFHMVITSLLDIVLETVIEHASQYLVTGISPSPSPTTASRDLVGTASMVPGRSYRRYNLNSVITNHLAVNRILQADDRPLNSDSSDNFLGSSLHVDEILHKASCENPCELSHGGELPRSHPNFQQHIVTWHAQADLHYMGAGHKMPAHLPYILQRALLMSNQCERAVHLLKRSVEMVTKLSAPIPAPALLSGIELMITVDPGVKVHWLIVIPRRRLQLVFPDEPGSSSHRHIAAAHTVLLIRSPLAGNFVVDPTAE
ncbi:hypothetical protein N0V94_006717 [Neodidymelliopsis sp. IMI 364377]|nr:hypothetical protein N0V94_006717 [Neodidymelliopsis sp. IMI 364377]